jgi:phospholipase A1
MITGCSSTGTALLKAVAGTALVLHACVAVATSPSEEAGARCAVEADDAARLACYDRVFRPAPAPRSPLPVHPDLPAPQPVGPAIVNGSVLSKFWELDPADKRTPYVVKTYQPNFLLPVHYTNHINRSPRSPTQSADGVFANYGNFEAKLQLSLRAKVARNLLIDGADVWFAYTQRSLAQPWNREDSAPFRTTDHIPEAIWVLPVSGRLQRLPLGWRWRMLQLGIAHESNGQTDPLSRSWNRIYIRNAIERDDVALQLRLDRRVFRDGPGDNQDLTDYAGRAELAAMWAPGRATAQLAWRNTLKTLDRGSIQFDWTYPFDSHEPAGLRWYLQLFHGYGETLIDYNHRQTRAGLGLSLFQF